MKPTDTFLDVLVAALTKAGSYNQLDQVAPAAVLWPDERREWEPILPRLRERLPVLTLGPYAPAERSGPVVWLRCALAEASSEDLPATPLPIVYLPGIGGRALRALAIPGLEPLAEFVYRGVVWTQPDGADWTPVAFLEDPVDGPKVQVRNDEETHAALFRALPVVAGTTVAELRAGAPWKAKDFEELMPGILALIAQGESAGLEFRSCARWRDEEHPQYTYSESIIRKSVAGFLNSRTGGTLLIGVRDDGVVLGLDADYQTFKEKDRDRDGYELWLMQMLLNAYGPDLSPYITITFHDAGGKDVCKVTATPAPRPVVVTEAQGKGGQKTDLFYVRTGNATNALPMRDAINYCLDRWGRAAP